MVVQRLGEELGVGVNIASIEQELFAVFNEKHLDGCKVVLEQLHLVQLCKKGLELTLMHD